MICHKFDSHPWFQSHFRQSLGSCSTLLSLQFTKESPLYWSSSSLDSSTPLLPPCSSRRSSMSLQKETVSRFVQAKSNLFQVGLDEIFNLLAVLSVLIHIRTMFLMPARPIPKNIHDNYNMFKESLVMSFCKSSVKTEKMGKPKRPSASSHLKYLKTGAFLVYSIYYTIVTFR